MWNIWFDIQITWICYLWHTLGEVTYLRPHTEVDCSDTNLQYLWIKAELWQSLMPSSDFCFSSWAHGRSVLPHPLKWDVVSSMWEETCVTSRQKSYEWCDSPFSISICYVTGHAPESDFSASKCPGVRAQRPLQPLMGMWEINPCCPMTLS